MMNWWLLAKKTQVKSTVCEADVTCSSSGRVATLTHWSLCTSESWRELLTLRIIYTHSTMQTCHLDSLHVAVKYVVVTATSSHQSHQDYHFPACQEPQRPSYCTVRHKECKGESAKAEHHGIRTGIRTSCYKKILCSMGKTHHLFFLHHMVKERNQYNGQCQKARRDPLLPKTRSQPH